MKDQPKGGRDLMRSKVAVILLVAAIVIVLQLVSWYRGSTCLLGGHRGATCYIPFPRGGT